MATLPTASRALDVSRKEIDQITTRMRRGIMKLQLKDSITVDEIARKNVSRVHKNCPMRDAVGIMERMRSGCLLVEEGGKITGILTKRVTEMALALSANHASVSEFAAPIRAVPGNTTLIKVARTMGRTGARHVLVKDEKDALVGIASLDDILIVAPEMIRAYYSLDDLLRFSLESGVDLSVHIKKKVNDLSCELARTGSDAKEAMRELKAVFERGIPQTIR